MPTEGMREKIVAVARECTGVREMQFIRDHPDEISLRDVEGGLLNYVIVVGLPSQPSCRLLFKYAPPYPKWAGPDFAMDQDRIRVEYESYVFFAELNPGSVPRPYGFSDTHCAYAVEFLTDYEVLREQLMEGTIDWEATRNLATKIAAIHKQTHLMNIGEKGMAKLLERFPQTTLARGQSDYVMSYWRDPDNARNRVHAEVNDLAQRIYTDERLAGHCDELRRVYLERAECLVHHDLHAGSVMVKDGDAKIIDNEFTAVGSAAFDLGFFASHYVLNFGRHLTMFTENIEHHRIIAEDMLKALLLTVNVYVEERSPTFHDKGAFISEVAGFIGCSICRRVMGAFHSVEVDQSGSAQRKVLTIGARLIREYHVITTANQLLNCIRDSST